MIRTHLGEGERITRCRADGTVEARAFHATDIEATAVRTERGVRSQGHIQDPCVSVGRRGAAIEDRRWSRRIIRRIARTVQDEADTTRRIRRVAEVLTVDVQGCPRGHGHDRAVAERSRGTEFQRTRRNREATREVIIAAERDHTRAGLDHGQAGRAIVQVAGVGEGRRDRTRQRQRRSRAAVIDDFSPSITGDGILGEVVTVEVEEATVDLDRTGVRTQGARRTGGVTTED